MHEPMGRRQWGGKEGLDAGSILKVEPTGFPGRSAVGAERRRAWRMTRIGPESGGRHVHATLAETGAPGVWVMWSSVGRGRRRVCLLASGWRCAGAQVCLQGSGRLGDSQAVVRNVGGPGMEAALKGVQVGPCPGGSPG